MKKPIFFSLLTTLATVSMQSQVTINSGNIFGIGDSFTESIDTLYTGSVNGGTNQTWDFSNLTSHSTASYVGIDPATTANASEFPLANLAFSRTENGETATVYVNKNNTKAEFLGQVAGGQVNTFDDPQTVMEFPSSFGDSFSDESRVDFTQTGLEFGIPSVDSVRIKNISNFTYNFESNGMLTTPLGTLEVLRSFETQVSIDSAWVMYPLSGVWTLLINEIDTSYGHSYWSNDPSLKFPMLSYSTNATGTSVEGEVAYVSMTQSPLNTNTIEKNSFTIFPNPSNHILNIASSTKVEQIQIFDLSGRMIINKTSFNDSMIDVSNLKQGVYSISIFSDGKWDNRLFTKN